MTRYATQVLCVAVVIGTPEATVELEDAIFGAAV